MHRVLALLVALAWTTFAGSGDGVDESGFGYRYWTFSIGDRRAQVEIGRRA